MPLFLPSYIIFALMCMSGPTLKYAISSSKKTKETLSTSSLTLNNLPKNTPLNCHAPSHPLEDLHISLEQSLLWPKEVHDSLYTFVNILPQEQLPTLTIIQDKFPFVSTPILEHAITIYLPHLFLHKNTPLHLHTV